MKLYKIAVIGAGSMGREHIKVFNAIEDCQVVGIFSRTQSRAANLAAEFHIPFVADTIKDLYMKTQADLVVIAVPELQAQAVIRSCVQFDWQLFMEKPVGYDLNDAIAISDILTKYNKQGFVGLNRRYYSSIMRASESLNEFDEPRYIYIREQQSFAEARFHNQPEEVVQKYMYANSIHNIDLFRYFGRGEIKNIVPIEAWQGEHTKVMISKLEFDSGDVGLYEGHWSGPASWSCQVSVPSIRWVMQPIERAQYQLKGERRPIDVELDDVDSNFKPGFYKQAKEVIKALNGQENKAINVEESLKTMTLIHHMFRV